jgi:hypothetical protein
MAKKNESTSKSREVYKEEEERLEIFIQGESLFDLNTDKNTVEYNEPKDCETQGTKLKIRFSNTIKEVKNMILENLKFDSDEFDLFEVIKHSNGFCHFTKKLSADEDSLTLE